MSIDRERDISDFIGLIYDAAVEPARWPLFLERLTEMAPGAKSVMMIHDAAARTIHQPITAQWDENWKTSYTDYYVKLNKWTQDFVHFDVGQATVLEDIVPRSEIVKSEFYGDWLRPQGLLTGVTISTFKKNLRYMNFSVLYGEIGEIEHKQNAMFLQALAPHLRRADEISRQMTGMRMISSSLEQTFDRLDRGVVLATGQGETFYINSRAHNYFSRQDSLTLGADGRVGCASPDHDLQLHKAIAEASKIANGEDGMPGDIIAVPRQAGVIPWSIAVVPISPRAVDFGQTEGVVALLITDPEETPTLSVTRLRILLSLTAAEARIVKALAEGSSPEEIAKDHGLSILTVRTHLRNAMGKVSVNRLSDLVSLALRAGPGG